jgi:hypothetical protein
MGGEGPRTTENGDFAAKKGDLLRAEKKKY